MSYPIFIQGRRVYLRTGARTQTVNVCTALNRAGSYEVVYRLHGTRVTADQVRATATLAALESWLHSLGAVDEGARLHVERPAAQQSPAAPTLLGRRVLVLGHSFVTTALVRERVAILSAEVAAKLTRTVTDVICLPDVREDDPRRLKALAWGLPVLTTADLVLLENGLLSRHEYSAVR
jgi:hypothetical protein